MNEIIDVSRIDLLILDLDDTIFETGSIPKESVEHIFLAIRNLTLKFYNKVTTDLIIRDLWKLPFDYVVDKYQLNNQIVDSFYKLIKKSEFELTIQTYDDYQLLRSIAIPKILVTTGFRNLQEAKIRALGITQDFEEIIIDDILDENRIYKKGIFSHILESKNMNPYNVLVIGDNPQSELRAGKELGIPILQLRKLEQPIFVLADFVCKDYDEVVTVLRVR